MKRNTKIIKSSIIADELRHNLKKLIYDQNMYDRIIDTNIKRKIEKSEEFKRPEYSDIYEYMNDRELNDIDELKIDADDESINFIMLYVKIKMNELNK